ncbi:unnamed protein product, partial [Symbiodinium sp. CCMP2456]
MFALQTLHKTGWAQIREYGDENFPLFNVAPKKRTGVDRDFEVKPLDPQLKPWLSKSLVGLQGGVRNSGAELVVYIANLTTQGVVSAPKVSFLVNSLQTAAANMPNTFVGLVFMPNRASDGRVRTKEQEQEEENEMNRAVEEDPTDDIDSDALKASKVEATSALRDFKYTLMVTLQEQARGLEVRPLSLIFDDATVYRQRNASHEAWLVTSTQATSLVRKTIFKRLVLDKVPMLPRSEMVKVEAGRKVGADSDRLSKSQESCFACGEMRQHLGGTGLVKKLLVALDAHKSNTVIVDLFGHDGWVGLAALQMQMENMRCVCATVAHTDVEYKFCKEPWMKFSDVRSSLLSECCIVCVSIEDVLLHSLFSKAKGKQMQINGFPDFAAAMADLAKVHTSEARSEYDYQVTVPVGGCLIISQALVTKFQASQLVADDFDKVLQAHDKEFNRDHKTASGPVGSDEANNKVVQSPKKLQKDYDDMGSFQKEHKTLLEASMGDYSLLYDPDDASLWVHSDKIASIPANTEWLGFGSGDFADGATANDILSDPSGRWFRYGLGGPMKDVLIIAECDRTLPDEVKNLTVWNKVVMTLKAFVVAMEDAGELVTVMGSQKGDNDDVQPIEKIVFIMDPMKGANAPKKRKISKVRPITFGAHMDVAKVRSLRPPFQVSWRVRLTHHRVISPVRPVLLHTQEAQQAEGKDADAQSGGAGQSGIRRLERFEVTDKSSGEGQEHGDGDGEEDDELAGPKKKPASRKGGRRKKSSSGSEAATRIIKKKKDDTDDSHDDAAESSDEAPAVYDTMVQWVGLLACHTFLTGQEEEKRQSQEQQEDFVTEEGGRKKGATNLNDLDALASLMQ